MKKVFLILLLACVTTSTNCSDTTTKKYGLGDTVCATVLYVGGAWLAHEQLPRLAGQEIEFNAPRFTKAFASILFAIGIVGGTIGAYHLAMQIRDEFNDI